MNITKKDIFIAAFAVGTLLAIGSLARDIVAVSSTQDNILKTLQEADLIQDLTK